MGISTTGNNEIRLLNFMFTIKIKESIGIIVTKQINNKLKWDLNKCS